MTFVCDIVEIVDEHTDRAVDSSLPLLKLNPSWFSFLCLSRFSTIIGCTI